MRQVIYTVKLQISEVADYEAATVTFEQYVADFNIASEKEFGKLGAVAHITSVEC
jgi:hypothetical protein